MFHDFLITENGKACACVIPAQPEKVYVMEATRFLASYLSRITGTDIPIAENSATGNRIIVGAPFVSDEAEKISVQVISDNTLSITGEGTRGPIYAVFHFLEALGCGFWAPDNETVPYSPDLRIPGDFRIEEVPAFRYRQPLSDSVMHDKVWCAKVGCNGNMFIMGLPEELGGAFTIDFGHSLAGMPYGIGFEEHPERFAWREDLQKHSPSQYCTMHPDVLEEAVQHARKLLEEQPDRKFIPVGNNDDDLHCQCEKCRALTDREGSPSALIVHAANYVAKALKEEYPDVQIIILSYWITERPPLTMKLEENVAVCFAMLDRDFKVPPSDIPRHDGYLQKWCELSGNKVYIWGYHAQFFNFLLPTPTIDWMGEEIRGYKRLGVTGVFEQMSYSSLGDFIDLRNWLFLKLAWKPDQDDDQLIEHWLGGACGNGAPMMKQYLDLLRTAKYRQEEFSYSVYSMDNRTWLTPADVLMAWDLFQEALAATKRDPRTHAQIRQQYASVVMTMLLRYRADIGEYAEKQGVEIPSRDALILEMEGLAKEFGSVVYGEGRYFDTFFQKIKESDYLE